MIKTVTLLRRRPDLSSEDFHRHWREVHAPLVLRLPDVVRYVQCRPVEGGPSTDATIDAIAEVYYADLDALRHTLESPEYAELLADEPNFMGAATRELVFLTVTEHVVVDDG